MGVTREELIAAMVRGEEFPQTSDGTCPVCGRAFFHRNKAVRSVTCDDINCRRTYLSARESTAVIIARGGRRKHPQKTPVDYSQYQKPAIMIKSRRCHDCGTPTNNYRCTQCLAKWRKKHGVGNYFVMTAEAGEEL